MMNRENLLILLKKILKHINMLSYSKDKIIHLMPHILANIFSSKNNSEYIY